MKPPLWKSAEVTPTGDARVGCRGIGQIEAGRVWAEIAIAASAAQLQLSSSTGQHHGRRRSQHRLVCQRQQRSAANSFQRGQQQQGHGEPRGLVAAALDAGGLQPRSVHGLEQCQHPPDVHEGQHGQLGLHVAYVARAGLHRESCRRRMTRDAKQAPGRSHGSPLATRAAARGLFCVPCARAGTRVEAGAPIGCRPGRPYR